VASSGSSSASSWDRVAAAILESPGVLPPYERRAIFRGEDPPELLALLDKVRTRAYAIVDADVEGMDADVVIEAALAAALGEALRDRDRALAAIEA
jgi:hypothetical protein